MTRRVRNFDQRALAILSAEDWAGASVHIDGHRVWLDRGVNGRVHVFIDPTDLASVDPARVRRAAVNGLRAQAASQVYTDAARGAAASFALALEGELT